MNAGAYQAGINDGREMMNTRRHLKRAERIEYLQISLALLFSGHALAASSNAIYAYSLYLLAAVFVFLWIRQNNHRTPLTPHNSSARTLMAIWVLSLLLNYFTHINTESYVGYIGAVSFALIAYVISRAISPEEFGKKFVKIMMVVSVISLVCFYILQYTPLFDFLPFLQGLNANGEMYNKYQGFFVYYCLDPLRNSGPFWEPGIFSSHLIIALLFVNQYVKKRKKTFYYIVIVVTIVSTASTAGYILLVLTAICIQSYKISSTARTEKRVTYVLLSYLLIAGLLVVYFNLSSILTAFGLENKWLFQKMLYFSENERTSSLLWSLQKFFERPILGYGFTGLTLENSLGAGSFTTTSLRLMAAMGIAGIAYTAYMIYGVFRQRGVSLLTKMIFLLIWLFIVNKEGEDSFVSSWLLIFYFNSTRSMLCQHTE